MKFYMCMDYGAWQKKRIGKDLDHILKKKSEIPFSVYLQ